MCQSCGDRRGEQFRERMLTPRFEQVAAALERGKERGEVLNRYPTRLEEMVIEI